MIEISLTLPAAAMERIGRWAESSGLPPAKFYSTALILGSRITTSTTGPSVVAAFSPELRKAIAEAANANVTPELLLGIALSGEDQPSDENQPGGKRQPDLTDLARPTADVVVTLPDELATQFDDAADTVGMAREKFYSLALVLGAHVAASTLRPGSLFPLELLVQSTGGPVSPQMLMRMMMMGRNSTAEPTEGTEDSGQ